VRGVASNHSDDNQHRNAGMADSNYNPQINDANGLKAGLVPDDTTTVPDTIDGLFTMELPPVTQTDTTYIDGDIPAPISDDNFEPEKVEQNSEGAESLRGTLDEKGTAFDPSMHLFPAEKTASGKWRRISKTQREQQSTIEVADNSNANVRLQAQKAAALYAGAHGLIYGVEAAPTDKAFYVGLVDSLEQYMLINGTVDIPPSLDLALSMGMFTHNVATKPTNIEHTKSIFTNSWSWIKEKYNSLKKKPKLELKGNEERA
jgi:hypothetical protein